MYRDPTQSPPTQEPPPRGVMFQLERDAEGSFRLSRLAKGEALTAAIALLNDQDAPDQLLDLINPQDLQQLKRQIERSRLTLEEVRLCLRVAWPRGQWSLFEIFALPDRLPGGVVRWTGVGLEVTDRFDMHQDLELQRGALDSLLELAQKAGSLNETELLGEAMQAAIRLTLSQEGCVHVMDAGRRTLTRVARNCSGPSEDMLCVLGAAPVDEAGQWGEIAQLGVPVMRNLEIAPEAREEGAPPCRWTRFLGVPIQEGSQVQLLLGVSGRGGPYNLPDVKLLQLLGQKAWKLAQWKRAEAALYRAEQRFARFMDHLPAGACISDASGKLLYVNTRYATWFGRTQQDMLGQPLPSTRCDTPVPQASPLEGEEPILSDSFLEELEAPTTPVRWLLTHRFPIPQEGEPPLIGSVSLDVTEQKAEEDRSRMLRDLSRTLAGCTALQEALEHCLDTVMRLSGMQLGAIYRMDEDGTLSLAALRGQPGPCQQPVQRFAPDTLVSKRMSTGLPAYTHWHAIPQLWPPGATQDTLAAIAAVPVLDGSRTAAALILASPHLHSLPASVRTAMETVAAEASGAVARLTIEEKRRHLEARSIRQQRLESIGVLAAGVAHEINNPLTAIVSFSQIIQDQEPEEGRTHHAACVIAREGRRLRKLVSSLLTFARDDREPALPLSLRQVVETTLSLVSVLLHRDRIQIHNEVPEELPQVMGRAQQLQQVLLNLLINARDALNARFPGQDPEKRLLLHGLVLEEEGKRWSRLTVEDSGSGISAQVLPHIFEAFFTTKGAHKGSGLGLSIGLGIMQEHGGRLQVESEEGRWTRFHLDLPISSRVLPAWGEWEEEG